MTIFNFYCDECKKNLTDIKPENMVNRNGRELVLCLACASKESKPFPLPFSLEGTAFDDIFGGKDTTLPSTPSSKEFLEKEYQSLRSQDDITRELKDLKQALNKELQRTNSSNGYNTSEDVDTLAQYQTKERENDENSFTYKQPSKQERPSVEEALAKLDALVGLPQVKKSIRELLQSFEGQKRLIEKSNGALQIDKPTLHMAFTGGDGTGKREVAKVLTEILYAAGHIQENKYTETDRSGLVGEHVGSTSPKVKKKVEEALGGVLFIHEANTLVSDNGKDFGREALATLATEMENHRDNLIVILGGVESDMNQLFQQFNTIASRITNRFSFQDYTPKQLTAIARKMLEGKGYQCKEVIEDIEKAITKNSKNGAVSGNGRWVENFVQKIVQQHNIRFAKEEPENFEEVISQDVKLAVGSKDMSEQEGLMNVKQSALEELHSLIGLEELKGEVKRIMNFFAVSKKKFEKGLSSSKPTMHQIFVGPPGTGKTTVAKIMAQFLKGEGILANGHLKEVSRADLVGSHVGETALKVKKVIQESLGGILFIDEAYALNGGDKDSFGQEAIDTLIKEMEENRDNLIVILAGYEDDMADLLDKNAGFKSRVAYQFDFPNYNVEEMMQIVDLSLNKHKLLVDEETRTFLLEQLQELADGNNGVIEGNGRWVRNFMDKLQMSQSNRIMEDNSEDLTEKDLTTIMQSDITEALVYMNKI